MNKIKQLVDWWVHLSWSQAVLSALVVFVAVILVYAVVDFLLWLKSNES